MTVPKVEVGTWVRVKAPGSREANGEEREIPGCVLKQHPTDGSVDLYLLHFEGIPSLLRAVKLTDVEFVKQPSSALKFSIASDVQ
jgi:hypothetical protein